MAASTLLYPRAAEGLEVILKLVGETCNLNCHYCYEKRKPYDDKAVLTPEVLRTFLTSLNGRPISVGLHGGEPLVIGRERLARLLGELRNYPGRVELKLQTNATLLTSEWLAFFDREWPNIAIGVSLDGDMDGNGHRVDYQDVPAYDRIVRGLRVLSETRRAFGVICVVTRRLLGRSREVIDAFSRIEGVRALKLASCLDFDVSSKSYSRPSGRAIARLNPIGEGHPGWATTPGELATFLVEVFDVWRSSGAYRSFTIEPFVSIIRTLAGKQPDSCHFDERKCAYVLTLYPDGRVGSCDELPMPEAQLGDVLTLANPAHALHPRKLPIAGRLGELMSKCEGCSHRSSCGGGCLATRLRYHGTAYDDEYCAYRKRVIDHVAAHVRGTQWT